MQQTHKVPQVEREHDHKAKVSIPLNKVDGTLGDLTSSEIVFFPIASVSRPNALAAPSPHINGIDTPKLTN
jgi:hypothetical protein